MSTKTFGQFRKEINEATPATAVVDSSKVALHLCLKRIKEATNEAEIRRLTEELQRIVFHRQYRMAKIRKPPPSRSSSVKDRMSSDGNKQNRWRCSNLWMPL
jgi:hypothetical protein